MRPHRLTSATRLNVSTGIHSIGAIRTMPALFTNPQRPEIEKKNSCEIGPGLVNYTKDALSVWRNLGKHFVLRLVMRLQYKDGHKTHYASRRTTFGERRSRRASKESSSRRLMHLEPVFILKTHNQTNYKCLPKFLQTDKASLA